MAPSAQNIYSKHLGSRLQTQIWSSTSHQTVSNIYKVETDGFRNAIPEAAIAGASFVSPITQLTHVSITDVFLERQDR